MRTKSIGVYLVVIYITIFILLFILGMNSGPYGGYLPLFFAGVPAAYILNIVPILKIQNDLLFMFECIAINSLLIFWIAHIFQKLASREQTQVTSEYRLFSTTGVILSGVYLILFLIMFTLQYLPLVPPLYGKILAGLALISLTYSGGRLLFIYPGHYPNPTIFVILSLLINMTIIYFICRALERKNVLVFRK